MRNYGLLSAELIERVHYSKKTIIWMFGTSIKIYVDVLSINLTASDRAVDRI
jgi:hypothetical protein